MTTVPAIRARIIPYSADAAPFPRTPLGWIQHTQAGNGSPFNYFAGLRSPNRKFSHFWIAKDGRIEQYQQLNRQSWAQMTGNLTYYSVEFEGYANQLLTVPQILGGAVIHNLLRTPDKVINTNGYRGIGIHSMVVNTACPGTLRANQRPTIILQAQRLRTPHHGGGHPFLVALRSGSHGRPVRILQERLIALGWRSVKPDGMFGPVTDAAVRMFQRTYHLTVDGIVGPATWAEMWS